MNKPLWSPSQDVISQSSVYKLMQTLRINDYQSLHTWSINNLEQFWSIAWDQSQILGEKGERSYIPADYIPEAKFFPDATLNVCENLLSNKYKDEIAITSILENGDNLKISWAELRKNVFNCANAMLNEGVKPGDRVVAWAPNKSQTVIYTLAALSIGAVTSTASPDFAPAAVLDRFTQIKPVLLLSSPSYQYNGKTIDCLKSLNEIVNGLPTLKKVILTDISSDKYENWDSWLDPFKDMSFEYKKFSFDHPGFILFSSGTTGKPKCIVHRAAGVLLKLRAEQLFSFDIDESDKVFFFTTCGWMMWNWLIFILGSSASIVLYDGSPTYPNLHRLLEIAEDEKCTRLGLSAKYIDLLRKSETNYTDEFQFNNLKTIMSTGSVLSPSGFEFVYQNVKSDIQLASISGGTDICGCFIAAVPILPIYSGEIQGACLGMAMDVLDDDGNSLPVDLKGELVCLKAFPSMPIGFWGDDRNSNFKQSYFSKFEGVWTHGDFASKTINSGFIIHGRSDATLNAKGVRIGTAEIYRVVEGLAEIQECLAVAQEFENDSRVILFVTLRPGDTLSQEIKDLVTQALKTQASPRHVPDLIIQAPEFPKTKSNKLVELAVADLINGRPVRDKNSLANPDSLTWFINLDLKSGINL